MEGPGFLPHLSGLENLKAYWRATGRPWADAHFDEALEIAGLGDSVHRRTKNYSHGMRQRLAIAQAMLGLPELLVLDEPTDGLDPPQIAEMRRVLQRYATEGRAVLVSSHLLAEVEQTCTHAVVVNKGRRSPPARSRRSSASRRACCSMSATRTRRRGVLDRLTGVRVLPESGDGGLVVDTNGTARSEVVAELVRAGIGVDRAVPRRRLEDAFLALVGAAKTLGEAETGDGGVCWCGPDRPRRGVGLPAVGDPAVPGRVRRQAARRRTQLALGFMVLLPLIILVAFQFNSGNADRNRNNEFGSLVDLAVSGGLNFTLFSIFVSSSFLLVVVVALFCGDTVASEASWGSLRYLLAIPVPRSRLLAVKLLVALAYSALALLLLAGTALLAGTLRYGVPRAARSPRGAGPICASSRSRLPGRPPSRGRPGLPALGDHGRRARRGRRGGAARSSSILDQIAALGGLRAFLPTHWQFAWLDVMQPQITWSAMIEGAAVSVSYGVVLLALAFRHFRAKDIVS